MNKYLLTLIGYYQNVEQKFQCVISISEDLDKIYSMLLTDRDIVDFCLLFSIKYQDEIEKAYPYVKGEVRIINWQKLKNCE